MLCAYVNFHCPSFTNISASDPTKLYQAEFVMDSGFNMSRKILLSGSNYHIWRGKMEDLLYLKDFHLPVFSKEKLENKTEEEWNLLHRKRAGLLGIG